MQPLTRILFAVVLFLFCSLFSCKEDNDDGTGSANKNTQSKTENATNNAKLTELDQSSMYIVYSYDTNGKMETCGCSTKQLGGLARRGTIIDDYAAHKKQMLMLDGGKLLPDTLELSSFKAGIILKMMNLMDYSALNIGCYEALFGVDTLTQWADIADFPFVSSNILVDATSQDVIIEEKLTNVSTLNAADKLDCSDFYAKVTGTSPVKKLKWLANPVLFIEKGNFKIGILAATDPQWLESIAGKDRGYFALPIRDTLKNLVVTFADKADLWIALVEAEDETIKEAMSAIPEIKLWLSGNPRRGESSVRSVKSEIGQNWQNIFRDGRYVGITSVMYQGEDYFVSQNQISIEDTITERSDLLAVILNDYRPHLEKIFHQQNQPIGREFVYSVQCQKCHTEAFQIYKKSSHSKALETLIAKGQNWNPDCVSCHTEFDTLNDHQVPMQCTACHYRVWESHMQDAEANTGSVKPLQEVIDKDYCIKCHNPENSTEFAEHYKEYFAKIKHWDGPTVPGEDT